MSRLAVRSHGAVALRGCHFRTGVDLLARLPIGIAVAKGRARNATLSVARRSREWARRVLLHDPARSLELVDEHERSYPRGMFAKEREVLAVEALIRANRGQEGSERGERFLSSHQNSAHGMRMRDRLQRKSE
jgi:hypothetical protein